MLDQIHGKILELTESHAVIDCGGVGFGITIAQSTYAALQGLQEIRLYTVLQMVDHDQEFRLYGFLSTAERSMYRLLKSVKGVGGSTAMAILSQIDPSKLAATIFEGDHKRLTLIKGIGAKTAQRIVVELKDRLQKAGLDAGPVKSQSDSSVFHDAVLALVGLGYHQNSAEAAVQEASEALGDTPDLESLVRQSLKSKV